MALLTPITIYSSYSIPIGTNTAVNPVQVNLTTSISSGEILFNFVLNAGATSPGTNPSLNFWYGFSTNAYTGSTIPTKLFSCVSLPLRVPTAASGVFDITYTQAIPVKGPYLYCWFDSRNFLSSTATITATTAALPSGSVFNLGLYSQYLD